MERNNGRKKGRKGGKREQRKKKKSKRKNLFLVLSVRDYLSLQWLASADLHVD